LAENLRNNQPGNHAAVAIGEAPKIMVRTHLPAIHAVKLPHPLLDERMARLGQYRLTAVLLDNFDSIPSQAGIMHDPAAGLPAQQSRGQQADDVVALDEPALLIEQKTTIEIPVPSDAKVGAMRADGIHRRLAILLQHGIRNAMGEVADGVMVDLDE